MKTLFLSFCVLLCNVSFLQAKSNSSLIPTKEILSLCSIEFKEAGDSMIANRYDVKSVALKEKTLAERVDSLEHALEYLKLSYQLNTLSSNIRISTNDHQIKNNNIQINILSNNFDYRLYKSFKSYYDVSLEELESYVNLADKYKNNTKLIVALIPFSDIEIDILQRTCETIDNSLNSLRASLNYYKAMMDFYESQL